MATSVCFPEITIFFFLMSGVIGWTVMGWECGVDRSTVPQNAEIQS